ncbi:hypothetical protein WSK_2587 [Novosphingobium sp. Rr 2-17]|uniref:Rap1a/Tai family immunity protein n=1 Tax=Novosphingobium sp. Rr 2-17 TaxID=555793 RepID=UPI0002698212|nr:Rap1a/Tai family immunity protein [Novosphingobium sp. Rr 2-17]EIZ79042.1 hypothetical protein WSK_2587 [Novosphingobium sp. Rr 2-17]
MIFPALIALTVATVAPHSAPEAAATARPTSVAGPPALPATVSGTPDSGAAAPVATRRPGGPGLASSALLTADSLRSKCEDTSAVLASYCYAYIAGVYDSIRAYETWLNMREFCRPVRVSQADLRRAFLDYLRANPQAASGEAASVVVISFRQKFSCSNPVEGQQTK